MSEFEEFEEWLEETHPEHAPLMEEYEQYRHTQHKIEEDAWEEYLQEWGRFEACLVCKMPIVYIQPQPENFPNGAELFVPCLNNCGGLFIKNIEENITSQFIEKGEENE